MALDTEKIIEDLKGASILELNDLVKAIEDEFDVTAAAQLLLQVLVPKLLLSQLTMLN